MRYRYMNQSSGYPILSWKHGPPTQTRAADCRELGGLGSLGGDTLGVLPLARPGAPEPVGDCRSYEPCGGGRPHTHPRGPLGDYTVSSVVPIAIGAGLLYLLLRRKGR